MSSKKVIINVGGTKFVTTASTLKNVPGTRLAHLDEDDVSYDLLSEEYFFDRNPAFFGSILDYHRTGELHFSHCLCGPSIKKELEFWGIDENSLAPCCWKAYQKHGDEQATILELAKALGVPHTSDAKVTGDEHEQCQSSEVSVKKTVSCWGQSFKARMWQFLEKPQSSRPAQLWAITFFLLILTSIAVVVMETHPVFRIDKLHFNESSLGNETNEKIILYATTDLHPVLVYVDGICIAIFTLELTLRFLSCPCKLKFFKSPFNIIDIFCVLPLLVVYIVQTVIDNLWQNTHFFVIIAYLSLSSVLRVFRLFKLARHYRGLKILQLAVRSSLRELVLLFMLIFMGMLIFSTLIYFAEFDQDKDDFPNIPMGFWWSIITMTTVGYGDVHPRAAFGYLVGGICAISGMLITGLPIPIIASNFNHYYNYAALTVKMAQKPSPAQKWAGGVVEKWRIPSITPSSCMTPATSNDTDMRSLRMTGFQNANSHVNSHSNSRPYVRLIMPSSARSLQQEYCSSCGRELSCRGRTSRTSRSINSDISPRQVALTPVNTTEV